MQRVKIKFLYQGVKTNSGGTEFYVWISKDPVPRLGGFQQYTIPKQKFWASAGLDIQDLATN